MTNATISTTEETRKKIFRIMSSVNLRWVEREDLLKGLVLSLLTGSDLLAIGRPGCAKSAVIKDFLAHLSMKKFSRQLNQFSTDKDLLGDINPKIFLDTGVRIHASSNTLLDCDVAFIDEVFKGTKGARAAMLEPLADRQFSENGDTEDIPLLSMFSASNELPGDVADAAFYSRLQLRIVVNDIGTSVGIGQALWGVQPARCSDRLTREEVLSAREEIEQVTFPDAVRKKCHAVFEEMQELGIKLDQRKRMKAFGVRCSLAQAEAWLNGRTEVRIEDLRVATMTFWSKPSHEREVRNIIMKTCTPKMSSAADKFNEVHEYYNMKPLGQMDDDQLTKLLVMVKGVRTPNIFRHLTMTQRNLTTEISEKAAAIILQRNKS